MRSFYEIQLINKFIYYKIVVLLKYLLNMSISYKFINKIYEESIGLI